MNFSFVWYDKNVSKYLPESLANFFLANTSPDYITVGDWDAGRCTFEGTGWSSNIHSILVHEFAYSPRYHRIALALDGETVVGLAVVEYECIEDIVIATNYRNHGLGAQFLDWLEKDIFNEWAKCPTHLECSVKNQRAIDFFQRAGYTVVSVAMVKEKP